MNIWSEQGHSNPAYYTKKENETSKVLRNALKSDLKYKFIEPEKLLVILAFPLKGERLLIQLM